MKLAIVTDAWHPQINGVVTTLTRTRERLEAAGHEVSILSPDQHATVPCPTYPEIRLAVMPARKLEAGLTAIAPDAIHVATEGPIGTAAGKICAGANVRFTTSYHTQFPQYVRKRLPIPLSWSYAFLRKHHSRAHRTLVATEHLRRDLLAHGFANVVIWSRGVDTELFRPRGRCLDLPRPIFMYAGRVATEKNLDAFLSAELPGTKVVVGDGPGAAKLRVRFPRAVFVGYKLGIALAEHLSSADAFVFPSRTDTFGLVMLEAIACGTPVAAYPVAGPLDVVHDGVNGVLHEDLTAAALGALELSRPACRLSALERTWEQSTRQFLSHLVRATGPDTALEGSGEKTPGWGGPGVAQACAGVEVQGTDCDCTRSV